MDIKRLMIGLFVVTLLMGTAYAGTVSLSRNLPTSSAAGSSFTVTLTLTVTGTDVYGVGITETYPSDWTVSSISDGGQAKTGPNRIEWVYFSATGVTSDTITYTVTIPANASAGTATFSGTTENSGAANTDTIGDTTMSVTSATSTTTTTTTTTTAPPYPAYVSRNLPSSAKIGASFTVTLSLEIDESNEPSSVGVSETFPSGWNVSGISDGGLVTGNTIEWVFADGLSGVSPVEDTSITYTIRVPSTASVGDTGTFSGSTYDGTNTVTSVGDTEVTVAKSSSKKNDKFAVTFPASMNANSEIAVKVVDSDTNDAIKKAEVDVYSGKDKNGKKVAYGMTDANGTFTFTVADAGQYTVYVDMSKYDEYKQTVTVGSGAATTTTAAVTTTTQAPTTTQAVTTTTEAPATTEPVVTTTQPVVTTTEPVVTTTEPVVTTTIPEETTGGNNMMLILLVVVIIIVIVVAYFVTQKGKGKPKEVKKE